MRCTLPSRMAPSLSPARPTSRLLGPLPPAPEPTHAPCCQLSFQNHSSSNRLGAQRGLTRPPLACPCPHRSASPLAASSLPTPVVSSLLLGTDQAPNSPSRPRASPSSRGTSVLLGEPTAHFCPRGVTSPMRARHMASTSHSCHCTVPSTRSATQHPQRTGGAAAAPPNSRGKGGRSVNARATAGLVSEPRARARAASRLPGGVSQPRATTCY